MSGYNFARTLPALPNGGAFALEVPNALNMAWIARELVGRNGLDGGKGEVTKLDCHRTGAGADFDRVRRTASGRIVVTKKISDLTAVTTPSLDSEVAVNEAGTSKRMDLRDVRGSFYQAEQTGDFTLALAQGNATVPINSASQVDVTIPLNSSVAFPVGTRIRLVQTGSSFFRVLPAVGVQLVMPQNRNTCSLGLEAVVELEKTATDEWRIGKDVDQPILQGFNSTIGCALGLVNMVPGNTRPLAKFREDVANADLDIWADRQGVLSQAHYLAHAGLTGNLRLDTLYNQQGDTDWDHVMATDANQPSFSHDGLNGLPCVVGVLANSSGVETAGMPSSLGSPQTNHAIATLFRRDSDTGLNEFIIHSRDAANADKIYQRIGSTDKAEVLASNGGGTISFASVANAAVGTWYPLIHNMSGGGTETMNFWFDREAKQTDTGVVSGGGLGSNFALLREQNDNDEELDGKLGAVISLASTGTEIELMLIREWMLSMAGR